MIKRLNNIIHKSVANTDLKETQLSIQINLDGFSFCIYALPEKTTLVFQRFEFEEKAVTPEKHLTYIEAIFNKNEFLHQSFKKVIVIHQNELASLVPNTLFNEDHLKHYLNQSIKVLPIDFISFENIPNADITTVYIPFVNINNFLFNAYGEFEYFHSFSKLTELLSQEDLKNKKDKVFLHVNNSDFELLAFKNNKLQAINRFNFTTAEDFIYYTLFVAEQFDLDTETLELILLGDIEKESELYEILYKYIRNVIFFSNEKRNLSEDFNNHPKHANFMLLN